jgi:hypothetical protein
MWIYITFAIGFSIALFVTLMAEQRRWYNAIGACVAGATWPLWMLIMIVLVVLIIVGELIDYGTPD